MSSTVKKNGWIAHLLFPITDQEVLEDLQEMLYDEKVSISINNEGTLVYSDVFKHLSMSDREDIYGLNIGRSKTESIYTFMEEVQQFLLEIDTDKVEQYSEIYYNGVDSYISCLTLKEYLSVFESIWGEDE